MSTLNNCQCHAGYRCDFCKMKHTLQETYRRINIGRILTELSKKKTIEREKLHFKLTGHYYNEIQFQKLVDNVENKNQSTIALENKVMNIGIDSFEVKDNKIYIKNSRDIKVLVIDLNSKEIIFLNNDNNYARAIKFTNLESSINVLDIKRKIESIKQIIK